MNEKTITRGNVTPEMFPPVLSLLTVEEYDELGYTINSLLQSYQDADPTDPEEMEEVKSTIPLLLSISKKLGYSTITEPTTGKISLMF